MSSLHASNASRLPLLKQGSDAVALNPGPTLTYLTGLRFHLMERPVVSAGFQGQEPVLVLPELEMPKAGLLPFEVRPFRVRRESRRMGWRSFGRPSCRLIWTASKLALSLARCVCSSSATYGLVPLRRSYPDASEALASLRLRKDDDRG